MPRSRHEPRAHHAARVGVAAWTLTASPSAHHEARVRRVRPGRLATSPGAHHEARVLRCPPGRAPRAPARTTRPASDGARLNAHREPPALTTRPASTCPPWTLTTSPSAHHEARVRRCPARTLTTSPSAHREARVDVPGLDAHHEPQRSPRGARRRARLDAHHEPQRSPRGPRPRARPGRSPRAPARTTSDGARPGRSPRAFSAHHEAPVRSARVELAWMLATSPGAHHEGARQRRPRLSGLDARTTSPARPAPRAAGRRGPRRTSSERIRARASVPFRAPAGAAFVPFGARRSCPLARGVQALSRAASRPFRAVRARGPRRESRARSRGARVPFRAPAGAAFVPFGARRPGPFARGVQALSRAASRPFRAVRARGPWRKFRARSRAAHGAKPAPARARLMARNPRPLARGVHPFRAPGGERRLCPLVRGIGANPPADRRGASAPNSPAACAPVPSACPLARGVHALSPALWRAAPMPFRLPFGAARTARIQPPTKHGASARIQPPTKHAASARTGRARLLIWKGAASKPLAVSSSRACPPAPRRDTRRFSGVAPGVEPALNQR